MFVALAQHACGATQWSPCAEFSWFSCSCNTRNDILDVPSPGTPAREYENRKINRGLALKLYSEVFENGGCIPPRFTQAGENTSPPLLWNDIPDAVSSYVLLMEDADAPRGPITHWILYDIPGELKGLPQGRCGVCKCGRNDFGAAEYVGPNPRAGDPLHHYTFRIYALDVDTLSLPTDAARADVQAALAGHVLGESQLTATCSGAVPNSSTVAVA